MKTFFAALAAGAIAVTLAACGNDGDNNASLAQAALKVAVDTAYGTGGIAQAPLSSSAHDRLMAVTVAPDGQTYAAGFVLEGDDQLLALTRLDALGAIDRSFGNNGIASVNATPGGKAGEIARSVFVQASGKIVVAGQAEHDPAATGDAARDSDVVLARFDSSGKLDAGFGSNGVARIDLGAGRLTSGTTFVGDTLWGATNLPGDKIAGFATKLNDGPAFRTDADYVLFGLTAAGALDTSFGQGGKTVVDLNESGDNARTVFAQADGKIVATGYSNIGGVVSPVLIRANANGSLDTGFGDKGISTAKVLPGVAESYSVSQQGNNYILAGYGRGADTAEKVDLIVYRFLANGSWDTNFGTAGLTRIDIAKEDDRARNVAVLPDGKILAVGSGKRNATNVDAMMVLLDKDGALDSSFGEAGILISDLGGPGDSWYGVSVSPDKKSVLVVGFKGTDATTGGNDDGVAARLTLS